MTTGKRSLLSRMFGGSDPRATEMTRRYDHWIDPEVGPSSNPDTRRLRAYAKKCASHLDDAGVPRFASAYPRDGRGTFRDSFWIIAIDVEGAARRYIYDSVASYKATPGHPPPLRKGQWTGHLNGKALLLSTSGTLASARIEGWPGHEGGRFDSRSMDMLFHEIRHDEAQMLYEDWGFFDRGRWNLAERRRTNNTDYNNMRYTPNWRNTGPHDQSGKGTSAALSRFVKSGGTIQWPRNFPGMETD